MSILCSISAIKELPRTINIYIYIYIYIPCKMISENIYIYTCNKVAEYIYMTAS